MGADYYATTIIGYKVPLQDLVVKKEQLYLSCRCCQNQDCFQYCPTSGDKNILHTEITYIPQLWINEDHHRAKYVKNVKI